MLMHEARKLTSGKKGAMSTSDECVEGIETDWRDGCKWWRNGKHWMMWCETVDKLAGLLLLLRIRMGMTTWCQIRRMRCCRHVGYQRGWGQLAVSVAAWLTQWDWSDDVDVELCRSDRMVLRGRRWTTARWTAWCVVVMEERHGRSRVAMLCGDWRRATSSEFYRVDVIYLWTSTPLQLVLYVLLTMMLTKKLIDVVIRRSLSRLCVTALSQCLVQGRRQRRTHLPDPRRRRRTQRAPWHVVTPSPFFAENVVNSKRVSRNRNRK